jgi:arginyl-tRNA synthetase
MEAKIKELIAQVIKDLYDREPEIILDRPEELYGDYTTNIALQLSKDLSRSPKEIADALVLKLKGSGLYSDVSAAGPGFINIKLNSKALIKLAETPPEETFSGKLVVVEYSDPNPFKILHAGHLYTSVIGDAIANLLAKAGGEVHRVNFGGDIGLHVAKTMWAILKDFGGENSSKLNDIKEEDRSEWLGRCYVTGNEAYETDEKTKEEVKDLNKRIYDISLKKENSSPFGKIYWTTRQWSYEYFESFYSRIGIKFEKYYPESEVADLGLQTVREHVPEVYEESQGAVIFNGEKYGLFPNVFINSYGIPTYSAKDVGLIIQKWQDYHYDLSVIITANEQADYMRVVLASVKQFAPELVEKTDHLTHGVVKLAGGQKMSSRKGNILKAVDILDLADKSSKDKGLKTDPKITIGAVKYAFVKQRIGADIIYDPDESVSLDGNSGPYLQYAYARAMSILRKVEGASFNLSEVEDLTDYERSLVRKIGEYKDALNEATKELRPHHIANYLYDLAQNFNRFYENSRVIGDDRQDLRLALVKLYTSILADGLKLLGIEPIETM